MMFHKLVMIGPLPNLVLIIQLCKLVLTRPLPQVVMKRLLPTLREESTQTNAILQYK